MNRFLLISLLFLATGCATSDTRKTDPVPALPISVERGSSASDSPGISPKAVLEQPTITLQDLLHLADVHNPEVAGARKAVDAASGRLLQSRLYPNPAVELEAENLQSDGGFGRSENTIAVVQPIIIGGRRSAAISAAAAEEESQWLQLEQTRREVFRGVHTLFIELLYLRNAESLYEQIIADARKTLEVATILFENKAVPEIDVLKPQVELQNLELAARRLGREREAASHRLDSLLGGAHVPVERLRGDLAAELPEPDKSRLFESLAEHPQQLAAAKEGEATEHRVRQAKTERFPDISFRLAYGRDAAEEENFITAGISVPLPLFDRNQGKILEAESLALKSEKAAQNVKQSLRADLAAAYADYLAARDQLVVSRERIIPAAEKALAQTREGYRVGKRTLLDLLDAHRTQAEAHLSHLAQLREYHLAYANIQALAGSQFETRPIILNQGERQ